MQRLFGILLVALLVILGSGTALADKPTNLDNNGNGTNWVTDAGFDTWGYNHRAHLFSGDYCAAYENAEWCQPWVGTNLIMKWNEAWLSSSDLNGDGNLDRHFGFPSYIGSGAWTTNHMSADYVGADGKVHAWTYFVKIVAKPTADYNCAANGGQEIWDEFCTIESVYNDPYSGFHGLEFKSVNPGFGVY